MVTISKNFSPKRTIFWLMAVILFLLTVSFDQYQRTRVEDVILSSVRSSQVLVQANNFQVLSINLNALKELNPIVKGVAIYILGERYTGSGESPRSIVFSDDLKEGEVHVFIDGLFSYKSYYIFPHTSHMLYAEFSDPKRFYILIFFYLVIFFVFGFIFILNQYLDIDRIQEQARKHALSISSRTLHGLKTHLIHSHQIYSILKESQIDLSQDKKKVINDYEFSRIEMNGQMSIMRLESFKGCSEFIDLKEQLSHLIRVYKIKNIESDLSCHHQSKLNVDLDIFIAVAGNIIKNAFDYADKMVRITTEENDKQIILSVFNTGKKLSKEKVKNIFSSKSIEPAGSGLGLSIVKAWVDKLGASIDFSSHSGGTAVEIYFPKIKSPFLEEAAHPLSYEISSEQLSAKSLQLKQSAPAIAIIDDIESFRINLANKLEALGASVLLYDSLKDFLNELEKNSSFCQIVIVDRHLRGEHAVRDRFPDACRFYGFKGKLILYSCDPSDINHPRAKHSFDLFLIKDEPIDWEKILSQMMILTDSI